MEPRRTAFNPRFRTPHLLGAGPEVFAAVGIDVQRLGPSLDDLAIDDHLLDAFEPRQVVHGIEQNRFHDGTQAAGAGLARDGLFGDGESGSASCRESVGRYVWISMVAVELKKKKQKK